MTTTDLLASLMRLHGDASLLAASSDSSPIKLYADRLRSNDPALREIDLKFRMLALDVAPLRNEWADFCTALATNHTVLTLNMNGNTLGDEGMVKLAAALRTNSTLTSLDVSYCTGVTEAGARELLNALRTANRTVTDVKMRSAAALPAEIDNSLYEILKTNRQLKASGASTPAAAPSSPAIAQQGASGGVGGGGGGSSNSATTTANNAIAGGSGGGGGGGGGGGVSAEQQRAEAELRKRLEDLRAQEAQLMARNRELEVQQQQQLLQQQQQQQQQKKPPASLTDSQNSLTGASTATMVALKKNQRVIDISRIKVHERLAEAGGSGASVFSCTVDGFQCAMKEMTLRSVDEQTVRLFEREIEVLEQLPSHNNIMRYLFHDFSKDKVRLFMTKYNGSLANLIEKRKRSVQRPLLEPAFSVQEISRYCMDVTKGLAFLHRNNVIHRDMKSDNIFYTLNERNEVDCLAIGDFGTAKRLTEKTMAKTLIGTPSFIAPEVLLSSNPLNSASYGLPADIYSFGMVLFELLTLEKPFENEMLLLIPDKVMKGVQPEMPPNLQFDDGYQPFVELHKRCIQFDQKARPTVSEVMEDLLRLQ